MNPLYHQTRFLLSAPTITEAPPDEGLEVAFAGRSNSGKSSAINAIVQQKSLARTSKTPGRTRLINFFMIDEQRRLIDLPGYGYAKVAASLQRSWGQALERYLRERRSLQGVFLVMDIRHPVTSFDRQMLEWCAHCRLPVHIALTKADKLSRGAALNTLAKVKKSLHGSEIPLSVQLFSAPMRIGVDDAHAILDQWLRVEER